MHTAPLPLDTRAAPAEQEAWRLALQWLELLVRALAVLVPLGLASQAWAAPLVASNWPLCGRIAEAPPPGWDGTTCPVDRHGSGAPDDLPVASTFGPRTLSSADGRHDFHRGIDLATPVGTPVFAVADGVVRIAGDDPAYSDPLVVVRHFRDPGETCRRGCVHTYYQHLSDWAVAPGDRVARGELLGWTGQSASGWAHLHFEVRVAPARDRFSAWFTDAVHPLEVLPFTSTEPVHVEFRAPPLRRGRVQSPRVEVSAARPDVVRVEVAPYAESGKPIRAEPGEVRVFDASRWNRRFTHKDSARRPWAMFGPGGRLECPHAAAHPAAYDAHVHLDQPTFNGVSFEADNGVDWQLALTFDGVEGIADCVVATATTSDGATHSVLYGECRGVAP